LSVGAEFFKWTATSGAKWKGRIQPRPFRKTQKIIRYLGAYLGNKEERDEGQQERMKESE
jgi:hypothetical protein